VKLLHVIASASPAGGGPIEGIIRQNDASAAWGTRELVTTDLPDAPYLRSLPMRVHALGGPAPRVPGRGFLEHYGYTSRLIPWLRQHAGEYDAVVVNGLWNFATMAASVALRRSETPYFVFPHGMMDPWFKRAYPLKHVAKQAFWLFNEAPLLENARAVLFTTEEERLLARQSFWPNRYRELVVGYGTGRPPPPAAAQKAAFRAATPDLQARRYILYLSRIHPKKGCDLLIDAFAKLAPGQPDLDLVIAGPDQEGWLSKLQEQARRRGVAHRIHWPGMLQGDAKWGAFHGAEAFVLPSHQENFGIVVAEALACGKPVLITDKVNIWREVQEAGAGLVASDDAAGILELLGHFARLTPAQRRKMARAAEELFDRSFDVAQTAEFLMKSIESHL
jgi:glycosyltransferase involved in cell wall biosynthesis